MVIWELNGSDTNVSFPFESSVVKFEFIAYVVVLASFSIVSRRFLFSCT